jgi:hypothetical protein
LMRLSNNSYPRTFRSIKNRENAYTQKRRPSKAYWVCSYDDTPVADVQKNDLSRGDHFQRWNLKYVRAFENEKNPMKPSSWTFWSEEKTEFRQNNLGNLAGDIREDSWDWCL